MKTNQNKEMIQYDLVVVGGGISGYIAAISSAQKGKKVALIEKEKLGGFDLYHGQVPLKFLKMNTELIRSCATAQKRGVFISGINVDYSNIQREKQSRISNLARQMERNLIKEGVDYYQGLGIVYPENKIEIEMENEGSMHLEGVDIILATGSQTKKPDKYLRLPNLFLDIQAHELEEIPKELLILGNGIRACEYASYFATLGTKVTMYTSSDVMVEGLDVDLNVALATALAHDGVIVRTGMELLDIYADSLGDIHVEVESRLTKSKTSMVCSMAMMATEEGGNQTGLKNLELDFSNGHLVVDEYLQTELPHIFGIGSVTGNKNGVQAMGRIIASNFDEAKNLWKPEHAACIIQSSPMVGSIGLCENDLDNKDVDYQVVSRSFTKNHRTYLENETDGFLKLIIEKSTGKIAGIHTFGPGTLEIIAQAEVLMAMDGTVDDLAKIIERYPSFVSNGINLAHSL